MTAPAPFSIVLLDTVDSLPEPTAGPYFVATKEGYMIHSIGHWGRTLVPTAEAIGLPSTDSMLWYEIDLPATLIGQAWGFFRAIFEKRKSEAMVDITWSEKHGYRLFVPPQTASLGGVEATRTATHYRGQIVGTIHSHCDFNAYHSSTDDHDADGSDGLHMTIGHVEEDTLDIAIMISQATKKWHLKLDAITKDPITIQPFPSWWLNFVSDPPPTPTLGFTTTHTPTTSHFPQPTPPRTAIITTRTKPILTKFDDADLLEERTGSDNALDLLSQLEWIQEELDTVGIDFDYQMKPQILTVRDTPFSHSINNTNTDPETRQAYERWLMDD